MQEDDYGRARVHTQWGDDAELIEEAVQMCPVDCIAYVLSLRTPITPACLPWPTLAPSVISCSSWHAALGHYGPR